MKKLNAFKVVRILALLIIWAAITFIAFRHQQCGERPGGAPTIHALCPLGGLATLHQAITEGDFIKRIHPSAIVLLGATILLALVFRRTFCGWICPLGAMQELFATIGRRFGWRRSLRGNPVDGSIRWVKVLGLVLVIGLTFATGVLVFSPYDPWAAYAHLTGGLEEITGEYLVGTIVLLVTLIGSLFVDRLWCRYLCPLGGLLAPVSRLGAARVVRHDEVCIHCHACDRACPVDIEVEAMDEVVTGECISCGECVNACPKPGALQFEIARRPITPLRVGVFSLAVFFGLILITMATGSWRSLPESMDDLTRHGGELSADNIRGFMTLGEIAHGYAIPVATLIEKLDLPADTGPDQPINKLMQSLGRDVEEVREAVDDHLTASPAGPSSSGGETAPPTTGDQAGPPPPTVQGTMTLEQIAEATGIDTGTLIEELDLPGDTPTDKPIKDIMKSSGRTVQAVRDTVSELATGG